MCVCGGNGGSKGLKQKRAQRFGRPESKAVWQGVGKGMVRLENKGVGSEQSWLTLGCGPDALKYPL